MKKVLCFVVLLLVTPNLFAKESSDNWVRNFLSNLTMDIVKSDLQTAKEVVALQKKHKAFAKGLSSADKAVLRSVFDKVIKSQIALNRLKSAFKYLRKYFSAKNKGNRKSLLWQRRELLTRIILRKKAREIFSYYAGQYLEMAKEIEETVIVQLRKKQNSAKENLAEMRKYLDKKIVEKAEGAIKKFSIAINNFKKVASSFEKTSQNLKKIVKNFSPVTTYFQRWIYDSDASVNLSQMLLAQANRTEALTEKILQFIGKM